MIMQIFLFIFQFQILLILLTINTAYRLVGLDNQWKTTKNTEATFTIQNAGNYEFEVKGANNDGVWNSTATTLKIIVKPAPWRSNWAIAIYVLLLSFSIYGLIWIMKSKAKLKYELNWNM